MDLKRLKHLVALADTRHFGRAAAQCHLTQSAFSRSIQAAEEELGLQLFDRGTLDVRCTDAGAFVVERARKLLFESHCLERDVDLYRERLIGDLAFGVGPFPAATMVLPLLTEIRARYPGVCVRVEVNNADFLAVHLRAEVKYQLAVVHGRFGRKSAKSHQSDFRRSNRDQTQTSNSSSESLTYEALT